MTGIRFLGCCGLAFYFGKFPHGGDDVAGDFGVFHFRRPGTPKSNVVSCLTAVYFSDPTLLLRRLRKLRQSQQLLL